MKTAKQITQAIVDKEIGLISFAGTLALRTDREGTFVHELYEQLTIHDPEATSRKLGDEISDAIINYFNQAKAAKLHQ